MIRHTEPDASLLETIDGKPLVELDAIPEDVTVYAKFETFNSGLPLAGETPAKSMIKLIFEVGREAHRFRFGAVGLSLTHRDTTQGL